MRDKRPENVRPKMSREDRAKQFAPFAALGHMGSMLSKVEAAHETGDYEREAIYCDLTIEEMEKLTAEGIETPDEEM